jgi:hypothetical protein
MQVNLVGSWWLRVCVDIQWTSKRRGGCRWKAGSSCAGRRGQSRSERRIFKARLDLENLPTARSAHDSSRLLLHGTDLIVRTSIHPRATLIAAHLVFGEALLVQPVLANLILHTNVQWIYSPLISKPQVATSFTSSAFNICVCVGIEQRSRQAAQSRC